MLAEGEVRLLQLSQSDRRLLDRVKLGLIFCETPHLQVGWLSLL